MMHMGPRLGELVIQESQRCALSTECVQSVMRSRCDECGSTFFLWLLAGLIATTGTWVGLVYLCSVHTINPFETDNIDHVCRCKRTWHRCSSPTAVNDRMQRLSSSRCLSSSSRCSERWQMHRQQRRKQSDG
jgi:hypothetical protein